jgi:hypothetical protein
MTVMPVGQLQELLRQSKGMFMSIARLLKMSGHLSVKEQRALAFLKEDSRRLRDSQREKRTWDEHGEL